MIKFLFVSAFIIFGICQIQTASAVMVPVPEFTNIFTETPYATSGTVGTSTALIGQSLFTDLLPWVAALLGLLIAAVLLRALRGGIGGGIKRVFGGRGRRR